MEIRTRSDGTSDTPERERPVARRGRYSRPDLICSENLPTTRGACVHLPPRLDQLEEMLQWQQNLRDPQIPKIIDLFCGAGGMSEGFVQAGFSVAAALDHEKYACETFAANIPARVYCTDIAQIEDPGSILTGLECSGIDVIVGGPPCQGFSTVGRARILSLEEEKQRDLLIRNELYQQYFRFVEFFHPSFFVMENVPALMSFGEKAYFKAILGECTRLGYTPIYDVINAVEHGVPQNRRRLIFIGCRTGQTFRWPRETHKQKCQQVSLQEAIGDLPPVHPPSLVERFPYQPDRIQFPYQHMMRAQVLPDDREWIYDHLVRPVREDDKVIFTHMEPGHRYIDIDEQYRRYNSESFKDKYYKLKPDEPSVTITAHLSKDGYRYIHWDNEQCRTISVREAARIQSFGDHFRFAGFRSSRFRQIGNAVPPLLSHVIAKQISRAFTMERGIFFDEQGVFQSELPDCEPWLELA